MCDHHAPQLLNSIKTKEEMLNHSLNYRQESPRIYMAIGHYFSLGNRQQSSLRGAMIKFTPEHEQIDHVIC